MISTVVVGRNAAYGVLSFCRRQSSAPFGRHDVETAEDLALRVAIALENAYLYDEARRTAEAQRGIAVRATLYSRLSEALGRTLDLDQTLATLADLLVPALADGARIDVVDERGRRRLGAAAHVDPERLTALRDGDGASADDRALAIPIETPGSVRAELTVFRTSGAADRFSDDEAATFGEIARRIAPAIDNALAYARERRVATTFQSAALNIELPQLASFRFDAIYEAGASEALVGGDWYDAFVIGDGRCVLSIGDVVGSGLEAAIAMINVRQTIRGVAQIHPDPALMLAAADRTVRLQYPDRFVTAFAAVLDPMTKQGAYASAGHPPALLRAPDGSVIALDDRTVPLGLVGDGPIAVTHFGFEAGCSLLLYTGGLVESERDVLGGLARLRAAFGGEAPGDGVLQRVAARMLPQRSSDDVAMLLVTSEASGELQRWRFDPFWPDVVRRVRGELFAGVAAAGLEPERLLDVEVVFAEVLSNLLRYVPGTVDLFLQRAAGTVVLHVLDQGPGFQFNPRLPNDPMSESGRGLFLIAALATQFSVERRPGGGSHARIVFAVPEGGNHRDR